ncbi:MAG: hypothetical protein GAK45_01894 [Pseudomonas citronellolis]|nr:MAG: hypothetical protein GAK45_01894 [Pseudomonas citronellolis]
MKRGQDQQQTQQMLREILEDARHAPLQRFRQLVLAFVRSECEEAGMRVALNDAAPLYRDAPEAQQARVEGERIIERFLREALPDVAAPARQLAGDLVTTTLSAVGKQFSESPRSEDEIQRYAQAMGDMFCAYLQGLPRG